MLHWDVIMHVEDDNNYAVLLKFSLKQAGFEHRIFQFENATEARSYLQGEGKYADRGLYPLPGLALIDIKMPGMSGLDLLSSIRADAATQYLPVIILTSSDDLKDVRKAYSLGANSFVVKPPSVPQLIDMLKSLEGFWVRHNIAA